MSKAGRFEVIGQRMSTVAVEFLKSRESATCSFGQGGGSTREVKVGPAMGGASAGSE